MCNIAYTDDMTTMLVSRDQTSQTPKIRANSHIQFLPKASRVSGKSRISGKRRKSQDKSRRLGKVFRKPVIMDPWHIKSAASRQDSHFIHFFLRFCRVVLPLLRPPPYVTTSLSSLFQLSRLNFAVFPSLRFASV